MMRSASQWLADSLLFVKRPTSGRGIPIERLLVISSRYPHAEDPISNVFVHSQLEELRKHFEEVMVIATTPFVPKSLSRWMMPSRRMDARVKDYSYENVKVHYTRDLIPPVNAMKRGWGGKAFNKTSSILKDASFKPDVVHAHFTWPPGYVAMQLKQENGHPCVLTIHENRDWFLLEEKEERNREIWKGVDGIIRVNERDVPLLSKYNERVRSIPNGYLHDKFKPMDMTECREKLGLDPERPVIFALGHLLERKGFHDLVDAMTGVVKERKDAYCVIGGDGPMRPDIEKRISDHGLKDNVRLLGFVDSDDVPIWINASNLFSLPSYSEGNPTVMFEVLGCGRPFIGTPVGGVKEIITSDDYGLLHEPGDVKGITTTVLKALETEWDRKAILKYAENFTWKAIADRIMELYGEVLRS